MRLALPPYSSMVTAAQHWFTSGWLFLTPYVILYGVGFELKVSTRLMEQAFWGLHLGTLALAVLLLARCRKSISYRTAGWTGLFLCLFLIPGAYLEFPSDAWEHARRIFAWPGFETAYANYYGRKMGYFLYWTLLAPLPGNLQLEALSLISTGTQSLLAYNLYLLFRKLRFSRSESLIQVLAVLFLFGSNLFSFSRYYALSPTPLAYVGYLQLLIACADLHQRQTGVWIRVPFLVSLILLNHLQEALLAAVGIPSLLLGLFLKDASKRARLYWGIGITATFALTLTMGGFFHHLSQELPGWTSGYEVLLKHRFFYIPHVAQWAEKTSSWGTYLVLNSLDPLPQTLGVHGFFSMCLAVFLFFRLPHLALPTLAPLLVLYCPPILLLLSRVVSPYDSYRILYAFPTSVLLVHATILGSSNIFPRNRRAQFTLIAFILLLFALPTNHPWRGRVWHQIQQPEVELTQRFAWGPAEQFRMDFPKQYPCVTFVDSATEFVFYSRWALPLRYSDLRKKVFPQQNENDGVKLNQLTISHEPGKCGTISMNTGSLPEPPRSRVGKRSWHWDEFQSRKQWQLNRLVNEYMKGVPGLAKPVEIGLHYWFYPDIQVKVTSIPETLSP